MTSVRLAGKQCEVDGVPDVLLNEGLHGRDNRRHVIDFCRLGRAFLEQQYSDHLSIRADNTAVAVDRHRVRLLHNRRLVSLYSPHGFLPNQHTTIRCADCGETGLHSGVAAEPAYYFGEVAA